MCPALAPECPRRPAHHHAAPSAGQRCLLLGACRGRQSTECGPQPRPPPLGGQWGRSQQCPVDTQGLGRELWNLETWTLRVREFHSSPGPRSPHTTLLTGGSFSRGRGVDCLWFPLPLPLALSGVPLCSGVASCPQPLAWKCRLLAEKGGGQGALPLCVGASLVLPGAPMPPWLGVSAAVGQPGLLCSLATRHSSVCKAGLSGGLSCGPAVHHAAQRGPCVLGVLPGCPVQALHCVEGASQHSWTL